VAREQTATVEDGTASGTPEPAPLPPPVPVAPGRKSTITLGPFLVALTAQDRQDGRPTVAVTVAYRPPSSDGTVASRAVQSRLVGLLDGGMPISSLQQVAEELFDRLTATDWSSIAGPISDHGFRLVQVNVALIPRDVQQDQIRPIATVTVSAPDAP
jgi:hypothetical protein